MTALRTLPILALTGALIGSCSLLFDGSAYRADAGGSVDGGCTVAACGLGQYCDRTTGTCMTGGCDEDDDCPDLDLCDFATQRCEVAGECTPGGADCARTEYCHPDDLLCYPCDRDGDGWAPVGVTECVRATLPAVVGHGDCNDDDPNAHPLNLPDCMRSSDDACRAARPDLAPSLLLPSGFEIGLTAQRIVQYGEDLDPASVRIFILDSNAARSVALVFAQTSLSPRTPLMARVELSEAGGAGLIDLTPIPTFDTAQVDDSALSATLMEPPGMGVLVSVVSVGAMLYEDAGGTRGPGARAWTASVNAAGTVTPIGSARHDLGVGSSLRAEANVLARTGANSFRSMAALTTGSAGGALPIYATSTGMRVGDAPGMTGPFAGSMDGGSVGALRRVAGGMVLWNGAIDANFGSTDVPAPSGGGRLVFNSGAGGEVLMLSARAGGVDARAGTCATPFVDLGTCYAERSLSLSFPSVTLPSEPFFALDHIQNGVFALAGLSDAGVAVAFVDHQPIEVFGSGILNLSLTDAQRALLAATAGSDVGVHVAGPGPSRITVGFAFGGNRQIGVGALHVCADTAP